MITYYESDYDYLSADAMMSERDSTYGRTHDLKYGTIIVPIAADGFYRNKHIHRIFCHFRGFKQELQSSFRNHETKFRPGDVVSGSSNIGNTWYRMRMTAIPVKPTTRSTAQYEYIEEGLKAVRRHLSNYGERNALLPLAAFSDGLDANVLKEIVEKVFGDYEHELKVVMPEHVEKKDGMLML